MGTDVITLTEHARAPGVCKVVDEQTSPVCGTAAETAIVPPEPLSGIAFPSPSAATRPESCIGMLWSAGAGATCTVASATVPFEIVVWFSPYTTHVVAEPLCAQDTVLPAPVAAGPDTTETLLTSLAGEFIVHCSAAGAVVPVLFNTIFSATLWPAEAEPEVTEVRTWELAGPTQQPNKRRTSDDSLMSELFGKGNYLDPLGVVSDRSGGRRKEQPRRRSER